MAKEQIKFESHSLSEKQDTAITVLCHENKARVLFFSSSFDYVPIHLNIDKQFLTFSIFVVGLKLEFSLYIAENCKLYNSL